MEMGQTILAVFTGLGLALACGFRVFVPMLIAGLAMHSGHLELAEGFQWLGEMPALIALGIASVTEIILAHVPLTNNVADLVKAPLAFFAGTFLSASMVTDMSPLLQWSLAAIAGGGSAELLHLETSAVRLGSLDNPLVAIMEDAGAIATPALAIAFPVLVAVFFLLLIGFTLFAVKLIVKGVRGLWNAVWNRGTA